MENIWGIRRTLPFYSSCPTKWVSYKLGSESTFFIHPLASIKAIFGPSSKCKSKILCWSSTVCSKRTLRPVNLPKAGLSVYMSTANCANIVNKESLALAFFWTPCISLQKFLKSIEYESLANFANVLDKQFFKSLDMVLVT